MSATAVLLLSCPDAKGIVAAVAEFVVRHGGNIVDAEQHTDAVDRQFFQRVEFELDGVDLARDELAPAFAPIAERFGMSVQVRFSDAVPRVAILVSRQAHCLYDLLTRWRTGELGLEVALVAGNHPDHDVAARRFDVAFHHLPVTVDTRPIQEAALHRLLTDERIDLVVLARYMQILSPAFVAEWPARIINIHHSFLPAFVGARPYHQAHDRGVKVIGVTAHYVTHQLDEGPIIEQDVVRVTHRDSVQDLIRKGRDLETIVLARAVRAHVEHRVLVYGTRTVVFG